MELCRECMEVRWLNGVVPPVHLPALVSHNLHSCHRVYTGGAQIRNSRVPKVMPRQSPHPFAGT